MKEIKFFLLFILSVSIFTFEDKKCWSSTYDDRKNEESLSAFKAKCASWSSTKYSNGYVAYLSGCGYQESNVSCCCTQNAWPTNIDDILNNDEKNLPAKSKKLLGDVKLYLSNLSNKIQIYDFSSTIEKLMVGDIASIIGTSLAAGNLSFLALDKLKENFLEPMNKMFNKFLTNKQKIELVEMMSKTQGFSFGARLLDKVGFAYGIAIPLFKEQIEDFKQNLSFRKHFSDLLSEGTIAYSTVYVSTEAGAAIGSAFFGGGAIPGAIAGFTIGVAIQLMSDGMIKIDGNTPADFIRQGFDKILMVEDFSNKLLELQ